MTGDQFADIRKSLRLTQAALAPVLGYGESARISEFERGARDVPPLLARLMAAYAAGYRPHDWPQAPQTGKGKVT